MPKLPLNIDCHLQRKKTRKACSLPLPTLMPATEQQLSTATAATCFGTYLANRSSLATPLTPPYPRYYPPTLKQPYSLTFKLTKR